MIFSTVPGRVTDGFPASGLSSCVCLVKRLHSPPAQRARTSAHDRFVFQSPEFYRDTD